MPNRLLLFLKSLGDWVIPESDAYTFETSPPQRVGDEAVIYVRNKRVRVMLHQSEHGGLWLVKVR